MVGTQYIHMDHGPWWVHSTYKWTMVGTQYIHMDHGGYTVHTHGPWWVHSTYTWTMVGTQYIHMDHGGYTVLTDDHSYDTCSGSLKSNLMVPHLVHTQRDRSPPGGR